MTAPIAPAPQTLYGFAGSTVVANFTFTRDGAAVNLTGAVIWMTVKVRQTDPDPGIVQLSTTGGGVVITGDPLDGKATAMIDNTVTENLDVPASLYYDVKVKESSGVYSTPIFGMLVLNAPITDAS